MEELVQKLRRHGIAVTPQRLAVLRSLEQRSDHPTAETIYQDVRAEIPAISFNTVYKTLETFCRRGVALKVNPLHEAARYDGDVGHHGHAVCRGCHAVMDLPWQPLPGLPSPGEEVDGFKIERHLLTLWGLCPRCRERENAV